MYYIYCYTNKVTNRKYVGQTNNIERRKREHLSCANNPFSSSYNHLFHKKLREYGADNFIFSILEEIEDINLVNKQEEYWIKEMKSLTTENGYNLTTGGDGNPSINRILSNEEVKELIMEIKKGTCYNVLVNKYNISLAYLSMINNGLCFKQQNEHYPLYQYYKKNEDYQELIDLLLYSDFTLKEISIKLNIGYSTVKKINYGLLRKGLCSDYPIRKITPQQKKANRVKEMLLQNASDREILLEVDVSKETIKRINLGETNKDKALSYPLR